ncbi:MAG: RNA polymerase sigma factor [Deltaproteobacteria bacterium]|nr:RNA polymerase sigma factor [Deltaproteobacteria bacterium]
MVTATLAKKVAVTVASDERAAAFERLVGAERNRAVALAYHLTGGDRQAAEDVAQEAFLRAYRSLESFRGEASLSTWFTRIVIREAARFRRWRAVRERWRALWSRQPQPERADTPPEPRRHDGERTRARIAAALDSLTPNQRAVFALVHFEGRTLEETALVLGKAPGTVKSHLHRALVALRRELADLAEESHVS